MNVKQLKYVFVLAEEGSFSRAADALGISQPSLSQYIKRVEKEVGMELFDRSGGEVRLTDAGRAYIEIGRKMQDLEHQLEEQMADLAAYRTGTLAVGISAHRAVALMPSVVKAFKVLYPGICLQIVERRRQDLLEAAEHGEFDLVITTLPVNETLFSAETVFVEENVVAVPEYVQLPAAAVTGRKFPVISVAVLNGLSFAMLNEDHLMQRELDALVQNHDLHLEKTVECTSIEALVEMVREGIGAGFIPACLAKPGRGMNFYSIQEAVPRREIVVMCRKEQYLSKAALDLKQLIHDVLA